MRVSTQASFTGPSEPAAFRVIPEGFAWFSFFSRTQPTTKGHDPCGTGVGCELKRRARRALSFFFPSPEEQEERERAVARAPSPGPRTCARPNAVTDAPGTPKAVHLPWQHDDEKGQLGRGPEPVCEHGGGGGAPALRLSFPNTPDTFDLKSGKITR